METKPNVSQVTEKRPIVQEEKAKKKESLQDLNFKNEKNDLMDWFSKRLDALEKGFHTTYGPYEMLRTEETP